MFNRKLVLLILTLVLVSAMLGTITYAAEGGTTWYLYNTAVSGVSPAGENMQIAKSGTTGWQPLKTITTTSSYWYAPAETKTYPAGTWSFVLWSNNPGPSNVRVDVHKTNSTGGSATLIASQTLDAGNSAAGNHATTYTFSGIAAQSLSNQRLRVTITKTTGADLTIVYNTNDFPTSLITPDSGTATPTPTPIPGGTTWYLYNTVVSGVSPAGEIMQTAKSGTTGWQPLKTITTTSSYWYAPAETKTYPAGTWSLVLWSNNPGSSTVRVEVYKTNSTGGSATLIASQTLDAGNSASGNHATTYTFSGIAAQSLSNQRLRVKITKTAGADLTIVYNTNDFPTRLIASGGGTATPTSTPIPGGTATPTPTRIPGGTATPTPSGSYMYNQQVWSDEFNGSSLDRSNWNYQIGNGWNPGLAAFDGWGNGEWEWYREANVSVSGGNLVIKGEYLSTPYVFGGRNWYQFSGRITTKGLRSWRYARVEARIMLPTVTATWPAFWMMGNACDATVNGGAGGYDTLPTNWASCGEVDIMEHRNAETQFCSNLFWDTRIGVYPWSATTNANNPTWTGGVNVTQWHVYAMEWNSTTMKWYLDGILIKTQDISASNQEEFHTQAWFIMLNMAIAGAFTGATPNQADFPCYMYVDYVRVYQ
jgi:beta-glucanase (GH16 family)